MRLINTFCIKRKKIITFLLTLLFIVSVLNYSYSASAQMRQMRVAVYDGVGTETSRGSYIACYNLFTWMNATVNYINSQQIKSGYLSNYDILVMPGGYFVQYSYYLEQSGREEIRQFVESGGSYFGICGGSIFGCYPYLNLFKGTISNSISGTGSRLINMTINRECTNPDLSSEPEMYSLLYWGSCYFEPEDPSEVIPIAYYPEINKSGMIVFHYGLGSVFLCSPHPEFEEGNTRDGVNSFDSLNDQDSEWGLLLKISTWLIDSSITDNTKTDIIIIWTLGSMVGVTIVILSIYFMKNSRRKASNKK
ncbi:MAG: BPL-N domain-containing protein [Candidatus Heimdallarchaeota archaeon]